MTRAEIYITEGFIEESFTLKEQEEFLSIVKDIVLHKEFERRCTEEFYHHGTVTLGQHIIKDTLLTYRMVKIYKIKHPLSKIELEDALLISLFHDLYTEPWQNNLDKKSLIKLELYALKFNKLDTDKTLAYLSLFLANVSNDTLSIDPSFFYTINLPSAVIAGSENDPEVIEALYASSNCFLLFWASRSLYKLSKYYVARFSDPTAPKVFFVLITNASISFGNPSISFIIVKKSLSVSLPSESSFLDLVGY